MKYAIYILLWVACAANANAQADTLQVYFDTDIDSLNNIANQYLTKHKDSIRKNDAVLIIGYADERGSNEYNMALSERRANNVAAFLMAKGINKDRIRTVTGKGEVKRRNGNQEKYTKDRKVDIVIISDTSEGKITRKGMPDLPQRIERTPVMETIILRNMNFYLGLDIHTPASKPTMEDLLNTLKTHPTLKIQLEGHVCCIDDLNPQHKKGGYKLSLARSVAIKNFLVENGIDSTRLKTKGFGRDKPLFPLELDEKERLANRRVEIRILSK
jgi:outer membrane protein OmpA-like peptidoglycan-associated protein